MDDETTSQEQADLDALDEAIAIVKLEIEAGHLEVYRVLEIAVRKELLHRLDAESWQELYQQWYAESKF